MSRVRAARLLPALAATLALALSACGSDEGPEATTGATTTDAAESDSPSTSGSGEPLALTADGSTAGKCAVPSAETLSGFDTAFEGTVTSMEDGTATLSVDEWYAGGEASTVTVEAPSKALEDLLMAVDFEDKADWDAYWFGPEFTEMRAACSGWYQVPLLYVWNDRVAGGAVREEATADA